MSNSYRHHQPRSSYPVPSVYHQTLLAKSLYEHCSPMNVALVALASKTIQNSSLAPNFATSNPINDSTLPVLLNVFNPRSALAIQFVPFLDIYTAPRIPSWIFFSWLKCTKYFTKSLQRLTLCGSMTDEIVVRFCAGQTGLRHVGLEFSHVITQRIQQLFASSQ